MNQQRYLKLFEVECRTELELTKAKNADYAEENDAFANFRLIEDITNGRITMEESILVRMSDKFKRVGSLLSREAKVKDESIEDTLRDISVYAKILRIALMDKRDKKQSEILAVAASGK